MVLDIMVRSRRSERTAKRFFRKLLKKRHYPPRVMITDRLKSYAAAKRDLKLGSEHRQNRYLNNAWEVSHQPTRRRERHMRRFKSARHAHRFLSTHSPSHDPFQPRCHLVFATEYHIACDRAFTSWREMNNVVRIARYIRNNSCSSQRFVNHPGN
ncbi:DDE-type integrase/transposase/recombinase [Azospirillum sp. SYSU D00513]|uniref:DDE-type integrase/transposase/recombinase n=1 Tax=Azospirillum sp. SYSU D00513 TaxID=2812561 RepID=UPI001A95638B|nr:DDE-type integrase/transposase/recombinase [Azospirillum sp. SYSU D00513]